MKRLLFLCALAALACEQSRTDTRPQGEGRASEGEPTKSEAEATTEKVAPPSAPRPAGDPTGGKFTLQDATEGLEGEGKLWARIETPMGAIECELFPDKAPQTVASFVGLARGKRPWKDPMSGEWQTGEPFFDGLAFHRVIPTFMIQGGDPRSRNYGDAAIGTGGPGYRLPHEVSPDLKFDRPGRMAMAHAGPGTEGSQFFITEGPRPSLDGDYPIFGQCDNVDVVKAIARVPRGPADKPREPVTMNVTISRK